MASPLPSTTADDRVYAKVFWRLVPLLMLCYGVAYLDRVNLGFAKLQMAGELGFSESVYGFGAGIFFLGYFFFEVPSNLILQVVGARRWIARIMITWGLVSGLFAFTQSITLFYILRFLLGIAEAGFYPGIILYLTYWYPSARFAKVTAIFMTAIPLSAIFGNPLSGWIMDHTHGMAGLHGWQWMFLLEAVPSIVTGFVVWFYLDDGIRAARWLTEDEKALLERNIQHNESTKNGPSSMISAFKDGRLWLLCLVYFALMAGLYGLAFWMPTLIAATGIKGNFEVGCLSAIPYLVAVVAMVMVGRSADARRERRWHVAGPALVGAVGLIGTALMAQNTAIAIGFLALAAAGVLGAAPNLWSLPTAFLQSSGAAVGIAGINAIGNLAGFASPVIVGYLKDTTRDNRSGMFVLAGILTVGAVAVLRLPAKLVNR